MNAASAAPALPVSVGSLLLTPIRESLPSVAGSVQSFDAGPAGLAVHLRAGVSTDAAERLDGERVWVTAHPGDRLVAFQGLARRAGESLLEVYGVATPVQEHRRAALRAATRLRAHLRLSDDLPGSEVLTASTVDLSRSSCRIQLPPGDGTDVLPRVGATVDLELDLGGSPASLRTEVLRVDPGTAQAVLRFTALTAEDADRIDRHVLSRVV